MTFVFAHRGSTQSGARENSIEAFKKAADLGADGVELDVRRTSDGVLVIHHDQVVGGALDDSGPEDSSGGGLRIETSDHAELPSWLPTLEEVLQACAEAGLIVNVEVKSEVAGPSHDPKERCAKQTAAACASGTFIDPSRLVLSSFSIEALIAVRNEAPGLALAWLCEPRTPMPQAEGPISWKAIADGLEGHGALSRLATLNLEGLHPFFMMVNEETVTGSHSHYLALRPWTVDAETHIQSLVALGVDAVITNDVATARRVIPHL